MKTVILVHGLGGTHPLHWQPWLAGKLEQKGVQVFFPMLVRPMNPRKEEWVKGVMDSVKVFDGNTVLVGHSLGVPTILRVLEKIPAGKKIKACVLVAGFCRDISLEEIASFVDTPFDWQKIRQSCEKFVVIYSDNDPFISMEESLFLAKQLGVKPVLEKNGGHITAPDYGEWKEVLERIERIFSTGL